MTRVDFREKLLTCLGGPWPKPGPLNLQFGEARPADGFRIVPVWYDAEPDDRIPALLLLPDAATADRPAPGIAVWHQHAGQFHLGKSEPAGLAGDPMHHTGAALAKAGYVVLCPDALCFEERQDPTGRQKGMMYERFEFLKYTVGGTCLAWKNILDMRRAVDVLASLDEVRTDRLGCYGHSMGSTHTWLVGPWEERLICLVGNCCLPTYRGIHREHMLHCFPNFIPGIHRYGDTPDIASLIAPRALHLNFGETDGGTPAQDIGWSVETIARAYQSVHAEDKFTHYVEAGSGHVLSPEMWRHTLDCFRRHLGT